MSDAQPALRDFVYLDGDRVASLAAQLDLEIPPDAGRAADERLFRQVEAALAKRAAVREVDAAFDFAKWTPDAFVDGQFVRATGAVRLLDYAWLSMALAGLPAVLRK